MNRQTKEYLPYLAIVIVAILVIVGAITLFSEMGSVSVSNLFWIIGFVLFLAWLLHGSARTDEEKAKKLEARLAEIRKKRSALEQEKTAV